MIKAEINLGIGDNFLHLPIVTELHVKPEKKDKIRLLDVGDALTDDHIFDLANCINVDPEAVKITGEIKNRGPVCNYRKEVIDFLRYAIWTVTYVIITPKHLIIDVDLDTE